MKVADQIVMNPRGVAAPTLVAAASRAGARGICNSAGHKQLVDFLSEVQCIASATEKPFGLRLTAGSAAWIDELAAAHHRQWQWAIISDATWPEWILFTDSLHRAGIEVLVEVQSRNDFSRVTQLPADGVILKGNESGARIGDVSALVMLQQWKKFASGSELEHLPFWIQGGIGPNTAAGCFVTGALGVVLDSQLLLCRESPLVADQRRAIGALDGSETRVVGQRLGDAWRICPPRGSDVYDKLVAKEEALLADTTNVGSVISRWRDALDEETSAQENWPLLFVGQGIALARSLADRYVTVSGVIQAICQRAITNVRTANETQPLAPNAALATSHKTRYPVLQGPMTRVSDTAQFAADVAADGGLPFLALALMRGPEVDSLLTDCARLVGEHSWGVGLLGFLPPEIRREQTEVILKHKPPYAIIAGGRPDQATQLEKQGIPTYLHVPSPGLLRQFLRDGARRFIFEGRECGGHVGPRSSFVLWETMVEILLEHLGNRRGEELHIVFAGGIHDSDSAAVVATIAAPLAACGVRIGVLMGTAYLFTREAVSSGSIVQRFQQEALNADTTVLFETGPGHAVRCLRTPYFDHFVKEKTRLREAGKAHDEIVKALEMMNIGRLRVASKGVDRVASSAGAPRKLALVADEDQHDRGMYMIGQVAALRDRVTTVAGLHQEVSSGAMSVIERVASSLPDGKTQEPANPCDVAIVGMACYFPDAASLSQYWENILQLHYAVTEVPGTHWDWRLFYDPDPRARDKIISKWGAFLGDIPFDPLPYGITPKSVLSIEPLQLLLLECVREAIDDAGYSRRPFDRERAAAVLGVGGGGSPMAVAYGFRSCLPLLDNVSSLPLKSRDILRECDEFLPEWTEDSFPGFLLNVAVGRVANRFNFGGSNYSIDAACASSLAAVHACIRELELGTADIAVAMGADTVQTPYAFMAFSKTHALSASGRCRPFDADADGIVLSEGIGAVILKRLADAERDGDRIYAVIRGIGSSSDGREKGLTAPNAAGQLRALRRAYEKAGISPARLGLIEAHGTGTVVGDRTEASALAQVMGEAGAEPQSCAMGSVKSLIGHSKCAAGIAGLLKATLALHHKVLPPTLVETPNPQVSGADSPLFLNTAPRPWIQSQKEPRCAGVSAFGFGGTNLHIVLEEYTPAFSLPNNDPVSRTWPSELFVWRGERGEIQHALTQQVTALRDGARPKLADYAASLWRIAAKKSGPATLTMIAADHDDLVEQMAQALEHIGTEEAAFTSPRGIYFAAKSEQLGKVAFLFPGQGAQYPNMIADLAMSFADVRGAIDLATTQIGDEIDVPLGRQIYPPSTFDDEQFADKARNLARTQVAQPAIGAVSIGLLRLLRRMGIEADAVAGHSYGEFVALHAAGIYDESDLIRLSLVRGRLMHAAAKNAPGAMAAVSADHVTVAGLVADVDGITLANLNAPRQTVISAVETALDEAIEKLTAAGVAAKRLDVSCAFHSPAVSAACKPLAREMANISFSPPRRTVYSNTTGRAHNESPAELQRVMAEHIGSPVRFMDEIKTMYADGVRVFIEVGPQSQLCGLVRRILADQPHLAVATDVKGRNGLTQLQHCLAQLLCAGIPLDITPLFEHRAERTFDPRRLSPDTGRVEYSQSTWMVNGVRSRLCNAPEPKLLGQRWEETEDTTPAATSSPNTKSKSTHAPMPTESATIDRDADRTTRGSFTTMESNQQMSQPTERLETTNGQPTQSYPQPDSYDELSVDVEAVMLGFQDVMAKFLDTQRAVMQQYLAGGEISNGQSAPMPATDIQAAPIVSQLSTEPAPAAEPFVVEAAIDNLGVSERPSTEDEGSQVGDPTATNGNGENNGSKAAADGTDMSMFDVTAKLIELVSERTGYPEDMLDPNLDLEADLGIDSIKRVEILGDLSESLGIMDDEDNDQSAVELEKLTTIRTLQGILDYLEEALFSDVTNGDVRPTNGQAESKSPANTRQASSNGDAVPSTNGDDDATAIQRGLVRLTAAPLASSGGMPIPSGAVVITDDGRGIAAELAERFGDFGQTVALLRMSNSPPTSSDGLYEGDLTCEKAVEKLVARLRSDVGRIAGFVHLLPLATVDGESWVSRAEHDVKSFYLLARALQSDLQSAAQLGMSFALAPTMLGGGLGFGELPTADQFLPGHGGLLGFAKCLAQESPDVLVRAVDFAPTENANDICAALLAELTADDGPLEVGYQEGKRVTWEPVSAPFSETNAISSETLLDSSSVVLLTGGARGITAAIAADIARRYQSQLILVGRSPSPPNEEPADVASLETAAEIKSALIARRKEHGETAAPAEIESEYQLLMRDREMRRNIQAIRAAGSPVEYHSLDVRDEAAFAGFITQIRQQFKRLDGIIHGAGVIEDKLIRDKTPDSFDRVFGTKVRSAWNISQISPDDLKFCVFFASIASRYGNKGQADYAAANEVLCKLAADLDRRWPARVFAVAWGPWAEIGMVSDLEKHLTARGVTLISPREGTDHLLRELQFGAKGETEVLIAGGAERLASPSRGKEPLTS